MIGIFVLACADASPEPITDAVYAAEFAKQAIPAFERQIESGPKPAYCVIAARDRTGPDMERARPPGEALLRLLNTDPDREFIDRDDCGGPGGRLATPDGARAGLFWVGPPEQGRISGGVSGWGYAEGRECVFMESGGELLLDRCQRMWES